MIVLSSISERLLNTIKQFAAKRNKNNKAPQTEMEVNTGPRVSSSGFNIGESASQESITASLLEDLRNETDIGKQIEIIANRDPDVSMAIFAFQRLSYQGVEIEITDLNGERLPDAEALFREECKSWNTVSNDGLDGIIDNLHKNGFLYNIMMIEVVAGQGSENTFEGIYIIDPREIEWTLEEREGKQVWIPYQNQNGDKVDLTTGNVFWIVVNPNMDSPIGAYLLESAVSAVDYKLQTLSDSSAVLRHNGYPYNVWSINKERLIKSLPASYQANNDRINEAISNAMNMAKNAAYSREVTQDIIVTDDIEIGKSSNSSAGSSIDVRAWMEAVDVQLMNGVKSLGILLNRSQGTTETWGSVQMKVITEMAKSFQRKSKRLIEQVGAIWLQLNGIQGYFKLIHNPIDYQSEIQKWEAQNKKTEHYIDVQNQGWLSADDAAKEAIGAEGAFKDIFEGSNTLGVTKSKLIDKATTSEDSTEDTTNENSGGEQ